MQPASGRGRGRASGGTRRRSPMQSSCGTGDTSRRRPPRSGEARATTIRVATRSSACSEAGRRRCGRRDSVRAGAGRRAIALGAAGGTSRRSSARSRAGTSGTRRLPRSTTGARPGRRIPATTPSSVRSAAGPPPCGSPGWRLGGRARRGARRRRLAARRRAGGRRSRVLTLQNEVLELSSGVDEPVRSVRDVLPDSGDRRLTGARPFFLFFKTRCPSRRQERQKPLPSILFSSGTRSSA